MKLRYHYAKQELQIVAAPVLYCTEFDRIKVKVSVKPLKRLAGVGSAHENTLNKTQEGESKPFGERF